MALIALTLHSASSARSSRTRTNPTFASKLSVSMAGRSRSPDTSSRRPAGPFEVAEGRAWTLPGHVPLGDLVPVRGNTGCLAPGLVTVGHRDEQQILIDLEGDGPLVLECDEDIARAFLASVALDCATHAWADDVRLIFVPEAPAAATLDRVEVATSVDEVIAQATADAALVRAALADAQLPSTWAGRVANSGDGWSPTIVVLMPDVDRSDRYRE